MTDRSRQHVAVLGAGSSGEAAARLLSFQGASVTLLDADPAAAQRAAGRIGSPRLTTLSGPDADEAASAAGPFDLAVLSPGIDPAVPMVRGFHERGIPVIAEIELAALNNRAPILAITGTNGKTTTTALAGAILAAAGRAAPPCGNIGRPFSDVILEGLANGLTLDIALLEISSFQLEAIRSFHPRVAAWLNFSPDHLDRYPDLASYRAAKLRIFENQSPDDIAVVNLRDYPLPTKARQITFSAFEPGGDFSRAGSEILYRGEPLLDLDHTALRGPHNAENVMAAMACCHAFGVSFSEMIPAIQAFRPAPHRLEPVAALPREGGDILFINDSKSTNVDSLEKALTALDRPLVLIAGGKDKGFDFSPLASLVAARARAVVLIGETRHKIAALWQEARCHFADSLAGAVTLAAELARPGDAVLLSPGASSFDMFKNYADRGDQFRAAALALPGAQPPPFS